MALSYVTYAGDGSTTNFGFAVPYIVSTDVEVYLDGVLKVLTTDYTWFNSATIQFNTAPANAAVIKFQRRTQNTSRLVDFQDAGNLTETDLDLSATQNFYLAQEQQDDTNDLSMQLDTDDKWEADSKVIKNVPDGVADNDAVNKAQVVAITAADVVLTNADVVSTNADVVLTNADVVATGNDLTATNADVVLTGADVVLTGADVTAAGVSATAAAASYDSFDDRYLGALASDPTLDNDGDALVTGALVFNTTGNIMKVYDGTSWGAFDDLGGLSVTKGNIIVADGTDHIALAVGADREIMMADSVETSGIKWGANGWQFGAEFGSGDWSGAIVGEWTGLPPGWTQLKVAIHRISTNSSNWYPKIEIGNTAGYSLSTDGVTQQLNTTTTLAHSSSNIYLVASGQLATASINCILHLSCINPSAAGSVRRYTYTLTSSSDYVSVGPNWLGSGWLQSASSEIDRVRIASNTGTIDDGDASIWYQ